ncbi:MAG: exodeoxyribonuclease VII large subunit [Acidimicrobiales bacterium mtb01]|nr:exodeoxyribonuclease VII large subunit [Actinomycetota bacterium]TEX46718.1 MAG: exodeoxyribonuclease VII large subunit [Acidimicrobiales bacterium mtb01]
MSDEFDFDFDDEDDEPDDELDASSAATYSISELASAINGVLEDGFDEGVWVWGEISGVSVKGGHTYFTLVEDLGGGKRAQLSVNLWAGVMQRIRPILKSSGLAIQNGLRVRVRGELDFYAPFGKLSLVMQEIDPRFTLGDIALQREELIRKLKESGLYDANRRLDVPLVPFRIGLVTSWGTAAWADFTKEIEASGLGFTVSVVDVRVQGDSAVREVSNAIRYLSRRGDIDVIAVVRGGGSKAELATFDAEPIVASIVESTVPVFVGVGHEIDTSVADEVAHRRYKTPTACAAGLVERVRDFVTRTEETWDAIARATTVSLNDANIELVETAHLLASRTRTAVARAEERLEYRSRRLGTASRGRLDNAEVALASRAERLRLLDPRRIMERGWTITRTADGRVVRSTNEVGPGDRILTQMVDGVVASTVDETGPEARK